MVTQDGVVTVVSVFCFYFLRRINKNVLTLSYCLCACLNRYIRFVQEITEHFKLRLSEVQLAALRSSNLVDGIKLISVYNNNLFQFICRRITP